VEQEGAVSPPWKLKKLGFSLSTSVIWSDHRELGLTILAWFDHRELGLTILAWFDHPQLGLTILSLV